MNCEENYVDQKEKKTTKKKEWKVDICNFNKCKFKIQWNC